uniref:Uncharacterized protein n=1 Tax=Sphaerodactylus townsendi TaxID=933632 RepID=A0ACB8GDD7_9SAUR
MLPCHGPWQMDVGVRVPLSPGKSEDDSPSHHSVDFPNEGVTQELRTDSSDSSEEDESAAGTTASDGLKELESSSQSQESPSEQAQSSPSAVFDFWITTLDSALGLAFCSCAEPTYW